MSTCSHISRTREPKSSRARGHEKPASSRQILNEKRPWNGRHFAIHQFSTNSVVAAAYDPMTIAHAPYPDTANTIDTLANAIFTAVSMIVRFLNRNARYMSPTGTLDHE